MCSYVLELISKVHGYHTFSYQVQKSERMLPGKCNKKTIWNEIGLFMSAFSAETFQ